LVVYLTAHTEARNKNTQWTYNSRPYQDQVSDDRLRRQKYFVT